MNGVMGRSTSTAPASAGRGAPSPSVQRPRPSPRRRSVRSSPMTSTSSSRQRQPVSHRMRKRAAKTPSSATTQTASATIPSGRSARTRCWRPRPAQSSQRATTTLDMSSRHGLAGRECAIPARAAPGATGSWCRSTCASGSSCGCRVGASTG